jgi:hypothetical protein
MAMWNCCPVCAVLQLELVELDLQIELEGLDQLELEVATELISS